MMGINILGIGTLVDSLYVIKRLVFESEEYAFDYITKQLKDNFPDRELLKKCRDMKGKYGTDTTETNELAHELSKFIAELVTSANIYEGVLPYAGLFAFLHDVHSEDYPATPDGRLRGERVSYGIAGSDIAVGKTVTTQLSSATHIANDLFADGNPMQIRLHSSELQGEQIHTAIEALVKGYFKRGGYHIQINVTEREELLRAKAHPESYPDLLVRISGYSDRFVKIAPDIQDALIERI